MATIRPSSHSLKLILLKVLALFSLVSCSNSGGGGSSTDDLVMGEDFAYQEWPNQSTTDLASSEVVSKVLVSNLDGDDTRENIFISVLPNSTNSKSSVLRITSGTDFVERVNFKSTRIFLFKRAVPFAFDLNEDGNKELIFVSHDREKVFAFQFKDEIENFFVRWVARLPRPLDPGFSPRFKIITYKGRKIFKIGDFGIMEKSGKKPRVIDLTKVPRPNDND